MVGTTSSECFSSWHTSTIDRHEAKCNIAGGGNENERIE